MKYQLVKDYKNNDVLRKSFHELTQKTFAFNLEEWYQQGFWGDRYIPYSLLDGDKVIANVSVNRMDFTVDGEKKHFVQLGTVMTEEDYRHQGLGRHLLETVLKEYRGNADGIYLFGNDSVLDYYPKFGFHKSREYHYRRKVTSAAFSDTLQKLTMDCQENREQLFHTLRHMAVNSRLHMDNYGLYAFYLTGGMRDQIYYSKREEAYAVAEIQGDILHLHQIIAKQAVEPEKIIEAFGPKIREAVLGFAPLDTEGYIREEHKEEDCTLFVMGTELDRIEGRYLRFPVLSHA